MVSQEPDTYNHSSPCRARRSGRGRSPVGASPRLDKAAGDEGGLSTGRHPVAAESRFSKLNVKRKTTRVGCPLAATPSLRNATSKNKRKTRDEQLGLGRALTRGLSHPGRPSKSRSLGGFRSRSHYTRRWFELQGLRDSGLGAPSSGSIITPHPRRPLHKRHQQRCT